MKILKFCLILLSIVFITGCNVKYNLEIYDGNITETATFKLKNNVVLNNSPYYTLQQMSNKYFITSDFLITHEKKEYSDSNFNYVDLKNIYNNEKDYLNSYALSICYSAYNIVDDDNNIQITTSNKFLCYDNFSELSDVIVSAKTNHTVVEHNADEVINDEYIWNITKSNSNNKPIKFIVSKDAQIKKDNKLFNDLRFLLIGFGIILLIGIIYTIYFIIKNRRVNKI